MSQWTESLAGGGEEQHGEVSVRLEVCHLDGSSGTLYKTSLAYSRMARARVRARSVMTVVACQQLPGVYDRAGRDA